MKISFFCETACLWFLARITGQDFVGQTVFQDISGE